MDFPISNINMTRPYLASLGLKLDKTTIVVIGGTSAFAGYHGGTEWISRGTFLAKGVTFVWLDRAFEHIAGDRVMIRTSECRKR